jgi:hypothetical protein
MEGAEERSFGRIAGSAGSPFGGEVATQELLGTIQLFPLKVGCRRRAPQLLDGLDERAA